MADTSAVGSTSNSTTTALPNKTLSLKTEDFIKMMLTQLQHQDPMNPAKNEELMAQMSQIGQLQSAQQTQSSLKTMTDTFQAGMKSMLLQNQLASGGSLIGKTVQGTDASNTTIKGIVNSLRVDPTTQEINLELDTGKLLPLGNVSAIGQG